ncbi:unnamed protein product, partial [Meganyctiphanes norvegica]
MAAQEGKEVGAIIKGIYRDAIQITGKMRDRAYRLCGEFLRGAWQRITPQELVVRPITGGLTNHLYYCGLPENHTPHGDEPSEVLLRVYGRMHSEHDLQAILTESVIFTLLSERELGPKLYGVFPGGRLEQYIPARSLFTSELTDPDISQKIAIQLAKLHSIEVPISKEPTWLWSSMDRWLKSGQEFLHEKTQTIPGVDKSVMEKLQKMNYEGELQFLKDVIKKMSPDVVFAHNDVQEGNLLLTSSDSSKKNVTMIDFEYCSYNYRGFDIANHFCEWMYEYKLPVYPFFTATTLRYPSQEQQLHFIRSYFGALDSVVKINNNSGFTLTKVNENETKLLNEVLVFKLVSHLFWSLWSIVQGHITSIPFGYMDYALVRMNDYYADKDKLDLKFILKEEN